MCLNKSQCMIQQKMSLFSRDGLRYGIVNCKRKQWRKSRWVGGAPTFVENDEFSEILTYKRALKTAFSSANGGGGVVRNLKVLSKI